MDDAGLRCDAGEYKLARGVGRLGRGEGTAAENHRGGLNRRTGLIADDARNLARGRSLRLPSLRLSKKGRR